MNLKSDDILENGNIFKCLQATMQPNVQTLSKWEDEWLRSFRDDATKKSENAQDKVVQSRIPIFGCGPEYVIRCRIAIDIPTLSGYILFHLPPPFNTHALHRGVGYTVELKLTQSENTTSSHHTHPPGPKQWRIQDFQ